jgi:DNA-binding response OmpR family regulator
MDCESMSVGATCDRRQEIPGIEPANEDVMATATLTTVMRILVVDDERTVCNGVEKILVRKGHAVEKCLTVAGAVAALEANPAFDLILADLMMPQAGGFDLLRSVRDRWDRVPVVIMTGYASIASAVEATRMGAVGYLPKPFTPDELELVVAQAVQTARPATAPKILAKRKDLIDVDMPFDAEEVAAATSVAYVQHLTRGDMPVVELCDLGQRTCKRFKTKGVCKQAECPLVVAERRKSAPSAQGAFVSDAIDVDMPFSAREVAAATSVAFVDALGRGDVAVTGRWNPNKPAARRVLVVDDEVVVANSVRRSLTRRGYHVDEAFTSREALQRILTEMYDLVLLDVRMPDGSGLELLPKIKTHRPLLPVVMVTGYASIDSAVDAIKRGASDYMAKPFTPDEIYTTASRAIRRAMV